jgi:large repetitive protein
VSSAAQHLVINEVDYDMPATDTTEYIEIFNPTPAAISLTGYQVVLVNGSSTPSPTYKVIDLAPGGSIPAMGYLVIAPTGVTVPASAIKLDQGAVMDIVQNGAPDGIALINTTSATVIDALSYEGSITAAQVTGISGTVNLVEGTAATAADVASTGALCRSPNGRDTDNANADWALCTTLTPGAANP